MSNAFCIVKPSFELFESCTQENYLLFLEKCTRVAYKSEDHIKEGSAEKLLSKVVKDYGHISVVEHASIIIEIRLGDPWAAQEVYIRYTTAKPILALRTTLLEQEGIVRISANIRTWMEFLQEYPPPGQHLCWITKLVAQRLHEKYPFFFEADPLHDKVFHKGEVILIDDNPKTNKDNLSVQEQYKHMTMTGKFTCSRRASHQLVRHRYLCSYTQTSQRYCNYNKKELQIIIPPSLEEKHQILLLNQFTDHCMNSKYLYSKLIENNILPEDAAFVLPTVATEIVMTTTINMWQHVIKNRGHNPHAQWEIRETVLSAENQIGEALGWDKNKGENNV